VTFTFAAAVAWDPIGKQAVKNVSFQVYTTADTGYTTPLAITDPFGAAIPGNILNSGSQGVFPQFNQATNSAVVITDPAHTYVWTINCVPTDAAVANFIGAPGSATAAQLSATFVPVLRPAKFGAVGDGVADDTAAFVSMYAATGSRSVLDSGKTYKLTSFTMSKNTDLNGATLAITGRLTMSAPILTNGTVQVSDKIYATGLTGVNVSGLTVSNTVSGASGISLNLCTGITVANNIVSGGFRGILIDQCDKFTVSGNNISTVNAVGAYGILINGADSTMHGNGIILGNTVIDCTYGITLYGGQADSTQSNFLAQYNLEKIAIVGNHVTSTTPDTLNGCIYSTRSQYITVAGNHVTGGSDVGIDFEYCTHSTATGNTITDMANGALSAIFGSTYIDFLDNTIVYERTKTALTVAGSTWTNTSNLVVLLRNNPQHINIRGNSFASTAGAMGKLEMGATSKFVNVVTNSFHNCYVAGSVVNAGDVADTAISDNVFTFDINTGNPVIYNERVLRYTCDRNTVTLIAGEVLASMLGKYITVYDAASPYSDYVFIRNNRVDDKIAQGVGVLSGNLNMKCVVTDNITDRITALWNGGVASSDLTYERNYRLTTLTPPVLTLGVTVTTGGTLAAGATFWKVTAQGPSGETNGSNEVTATLTGTTSSQPLSWTNPVGTTGIRVWRGIAAGAENTLVASLGVVTSYTDAGGGTAVSIPTTNTAAPGYTKLTAHDNAGLNPTVPTLS